MKQGVKKLVVVADSCHLILYEASGNKITNGPIKEAIPFSHHRRPEKVHGSYDRSAGHSVSGGPPHTMPKEIDQQEAARMICQRLEVLFREKPEYLELVICAEPRMLGHIRQHLGKELEKKVSKEIHKDLVDKGIDFIEEELCK